MLDSPVATITGTLYGDGAIIIIIIIKLYFRPQPIDTHIYKYKYSMVKYIYNKTEVNYNEVS